MYAFLNTWRKSLKSVPQLRFYIQEPGCNGYDFHYHQTERPEFVLGRTANQCGERVVRIQLQDPRVSRNHCRIFLHPRGYWMIEDLGSTNGTYIQLPDAELDLWQQVQYATPLPDEIDIRIGATLLAMRPLESHTPARFAVKQAA
ncbi:MAG: FHA domain-containing protein [Magnetococcales bacterium]|nr:FHA domain-containing protein [Magnetococcales bacterium]